MDPLAALRELDLAMGDDDPRGVAEAADALAAWLEGGGFRPTIPGWRGGLTTVQLVEHLRSLEQVARMFHDDSDDSDSDE